MSVIDQYQQLSRLNPLTKESQALSDSRQAKIDANIVDALKKERFKRAVIVYGVTHRPAIVRAVVRSKSARLLSLQEAMKPKVDGFFDRTHSLMIGK